MAKILFLFLVPILALAAPRRKVIIDQDAFGPGGPNLQPILMVLQSPDVEVLGITVESGDGWQKENVAHTLRMLELIGRPEIPVVPGATFPLVNSAEATKRWEARHGKLFYKGAWTEEWSKEVLVRRPEPHGPEVVPPLIEGDPALKPAAETAAEFLVRQVRRYPGEVSILAMGPMTNLALASRLDDGFAAGAKELVFMGGSFNPRPADNAFALEYVYTPRLEFNFRWDPEAASAVLRSPWRRIVQVPVDPSTRTLFRPGMIQAVAAATTPVARYVAAHVESFPLWDEIAAAVWLEPALATRRERVAVDVDTAADGAGYGNTLSWAPGRGPGLGEPVVEVVFEVDVAGLEALVVERLTRAGP
ncbi:nucleoside hydrolase [Lacunisphaera limnophila]|uniref:nucleoside hydrolase n=1 Tax=Lacunisphaera limnophila TaxID=1838286 RepID=UPI001C54C0CD|nr:nucleoside hydrolase [Lacunisphaera limnophila]